MKHSETKMISDGTKIIGVEDIQKKGQYLV